MPKFARCKAAWCWYAPSASPRVVTLIFSAATNSGSVTGSRKMYQHFRQTTRERRTGSARRTARSGASVRQSNGISSSEFETCRRRRRSPKPHERWTVSKMNVKYCFNCCYLSLDDALINGIRSPRGAGSTRDHRRQGPNNACYLAVTVQFLLSLIV